MPNRKVIMENSTQEKVNKLIAKHVDKVSDLSQYQNKVIMNHENQIRNLNKSINFLACVQIATLIVVGLIHAAHSGWFDNIGWLQ